MQNNFVDEVELTIILDILKCDTERPRRQYSDKH